MYVLFDMKTLERSRTVFLIKTGILALSPSYNDNVVFLYVQNYVSKYECIKASILHTSDIRPTCKYTGPDLCPYFRVYVHTQ